MKALDAESNAEKHGIGITVAILFIVGEIAGTGVLAFPESMRGLGWFGSLVILIGGLGAGYAGVILGRSWMLLEDADPSLQDVTTRNPYSLIGYKAGGRIGRSTTTITLIIMLFGSAVVQMLIFAETIYTLIPDNPITFCKWIVIVGVILLPFSLLGSPVDFWPVAFFAMSSTTVACILIIIAVFLETYPTETSDLVVQKTDGIHGITVRSALLGVSTIVFGYGGASVLPTIQNDMRNKRKFTRAVIVAFILMICLYLPVSAIGYWKFGNDVKANIVRNLTPSALTTLIECLVLAHTFCAFLIQLNPVNLTIENMLGLDHSFNWKRGLSRTCVILVVIFTGLTIPKFTRLLNLVGSFAITLQSYVLPALFYYILCPKKNASTLVKISLITIIVAGSLVTVSSTFYALLDIFHPDAFTTPCYICDCVKLD